jgi:hypothetical protein
VSSEELEKSLRSEIESYLSGRLDDVRAEVARLHNYVGEAFTSLLERASQAEAAPSESSIAATIAEHLRAAHERGLEQAAAESAKAQAANDVALLKAAVEAIDNQRSQADILGALVNRAASFAPRVAFFVVRNEQAQGWRARGLEGAVGDDAIRQVALSLSDDHAVSEACRTRAVWSGSAGSHAQGYLLFNRLGDEPPQHVAALPLSIRDKVVAVLYADSGALDGEAVKLEALETLVCVTGMAVELLAVTRSAPRALAATPAVAAPAPEPAAEDSSAGDTAAVAAAGGAVAAVAEETAATAEEAETAETVETVEAAETVETETEAVTEDAPAAEEARAAEPAEETEAEMAAEVEAAPEAAFEAQEVSFAETAPEEAVAEPEPEQAEAAPEMMAQTYAWAEPTAEAAPEAVSLAAEEEAVGSSDEEPARAETDAATPEPAYDYYAGESAPAAVAEEETAAAEESVEFTEPAPALAETVYYSVEAEPAPEAVAEAEPAPAAEEPAAPFAVTEEVAAEAGNVMEETAAPVAEDAPGYFPPMPAPPETGFSFNAPTPEFVAAAESVEIPEPESYAAPAPAISPDTGSWEMIETATQDDAPAALQEAAPVPAMPETAPGFVTYQPIAPLESEAYAPPAPPVVEGFNEEFAAPAPPPPSHYTTPLGSTRTFGREIDLPISVSDDERRLHTDARRFARLLVSEIKLYNEPKVQEGREAGNIYNLLREAIDRSRQMYDRRVAPPVAAQFDYFHYELVNTLAEGDAAKLGLEYPGAAV